MTMVVARLCYPYPLLIALFASQIKIHAVSAFTSTKVSSSLPTLLEWQDEVFGSALSLQPTPLKQAGATLARDGVVRIASEDVSICKEQCKELRLDILKVVDDGNSKWGDSNSAKKKDECNRFVPGTRIRFEQPIDLAFAGDARHDVLLPLDTWPVLKAVLGAAVGQLQESLFVPAAQLLLPRLENDSQEHDNLELVEVAALLSRPGSRHQDAHGDYRRFVDHVDTTEPHEYTQQRVGKLPPRLVCFVALQDVPTKRHGATAFLTGTHNAQAHDLVYGENNNNLGLQVATKTENDKAACTAVEDKRRELLDLSGRNAQGAVTSHGFKCGDLLVYDASVLHWGGANSQPENDRIMFYFGVARPGAAARVAEGLGDNQGLLEATPPVLLKDVATTL